MHKRCAEVARDFFKNILKRRRHRLCALHGEGEAVGLLFAVIRVLPEYNYFYFFKRTKVKRAENVLRVRIYFPALIFFLYERLKFREIWLLELVREVFFP